MRVVIAEDDDVRLPPGFLDALHRVAGGGTVMDPEVVSQLMVRRRADDPIRTLTPREREVLALMAEGLADQDIAARLVVTETAVAKLGLAQGDAGHRRVRAVLTYLES